MASGGGRERWGLGAPGVGWVEGGEHPVHILCACVGGCVRCGFFDGWLVVVR